MCLAQRKYKIVKFGILRKSGLMEVLLFCANAPDNFLERKLGMKREVSWGLHFPIHFHPWLSKLGKVNAY